MRMLIATLAATAALGLTAAHADTVAIDDPLHLCYAAPVNCTGFNGVTISTNPATGLSGWGFSSSPKSQSGTLDIILMVPNNEQEIVLPTLTGTLNGNPLNLYRSHHPNADVDAAKAAVLAAIKDAAPWSDFGLKRSSRKQAARRQADLIGPLSRPRRPTRFGALFFPAEVRRLVAQARGRRPRSPSRPFIRTSTQLPLSFSPLAVNFSSPLCSAASTSAVLSSGSRSRGPTA